jgi:hypothetical protein
MTTVGEIEKSAKSAKSNQSNQSKNRINDGAATRNVSFRESGIWGRRP